MLLYSSGGVVNVLCDKGSTAECVCMCVCLHVSTQICVCLGFFCLLDVSWNGPGLPLSGPIRGSCLYPSLITLLRANIPFVFLFFSLFHSLSPFVVAGLGRGSATYHQQSLLLVLFLFSLCPFSTHCQSEFESHTK